MGVTMEASDACTHLEVLVIIGAFVAVTALFSFFALGTTILPGQTSGICTYPTLIKDDSPLQLLGNVTASSVVSSPSGIYIDTLSFTIGHTGQGDAIDLPKVTVTVMTSQYLDILERTDESFPMAGEWAVVSSPHGDDDDILEAGEECTIRIALPRPVLSSDDLIVKIRPEGGAPFSITKPIVVVQPTAGESPPAGKD
jgi:archaellin